MSTLFFNTRYKPMNSISDFEQAIDYFNKDDRADKTLLEQKGEHDAEDMFSYYFYRKGSCGGFDSQGDKSYEAIMDEYQAYRPSYIWQSVISFTREDAIEFGLKTKKDFVSLTRKVVVKMAQEKNIPLKDVCWGGFYHVNTDHPHVHFYFYNRSDPLDRTLFRSESITRIRAAIAREVIDRSVLLKDKEDAGRKVLMNIRNLLNDDMLIEQLTSYRSERTFESREFLHPKFKLKNEFFKQLAYLDEVLPLKGRLSYNAHVMEPFKEELDKMIEILLKQDGMKDDYRIFLKQLEDVHQSNESLYGEGTKQSEYINDQIHRLYGSLGNAVLKMIKLFREMKEENHELRFSEYLPKKEYNREIRKMIRPYGFDLMRYSMRSLCHEISLMKQMTRIRMRDQQLMLKEVEKERRREEEVEHAS